MLCPNGAESQSSVGFDVGVPAWPTVTYYSRASVMKFVGPTRVKLAHTPSANIAFGVIVVMGIEKTPVDVIRMVVT